MTLNSTTIRYTTEGAGSSSSNIYIQTEDECLRQMQNCTGQTICLCARDKVKIMQMWDNAPSKAGIYIGIILLGYILGLVLLLLHFVNQKYGELNLYDIYLEIADIFTSRSSSFVENNDENRMERSPSLNATNGDNRRSGIDFMDEEEEDSDEVEERNEESEIEDNDKYLKAGDTTLLQTKKEKLRHWSSLTTIKDEQGGQDNFALSKFKKTSLSVSRMIQSSNGTNTLFRRGGETLEMTRRYRINQNYNTVDGNNLEMIEVLSEEKC